MARASEGRGSFAEAVEHHTRAQVAREQRRRRGEASTDTRDRLNTWCRQHVPDLLLAHGAGVVLGSAMLLEYAGTLSADGVRERVEARAARLR